MHPWANILSVSDPAPAPPLVSQQIQQAHPAHDGSSTHSPTQPSLKISIIFTSLFNTLLIFQQFLCQINKNWYLIEYIIHRLYSILN
jgi:hypothetical protein